MCTIILSICLAASLAYNLYQRKKIGDGYNHAAEIMNDACTAIRKKQLESRGKKVSRVTKAGRFNRKGS